MIFLYYIYCHKYARMQGYLGRKWSSGVKIKVFRVANCHLLDMTLGKSLNLSQLQFPYLLF